MYSFVDAAQGYHQIPMKKEDQEKTSFITHQGLYCYNVMPFGLMNTGATYQRFMNFIFKKDIGKTIEVYVDDLIVKNKNSESHANDLEWVFQTFDNYKVELNPDKCVFGIKAGKFLGFMISQREIEANPEKMQAIFNMKTPTTLNKLQ